MATEVASAPAVQVPDSPYIGLTHFTEADSALFFGRETERKIIISNLSASRLTLLYAESGVGKSSLLRAGVAVRLRELAEENIAEGEPVEQIPVVFSSWSGDPIDELVNAIGKAARPYGLKAALPRDRLGTAIETISGELDARLLLILDQFEEYFQYRAVNDPEGTFADQLAECINRRDLRAGFLIAIREDAYAWLGDFAQGRIPNIFANYLHLEYLGRKAAEAAIRGPLKLFNDQPGGPFSIEKGLVAAVLDGVQRDTGTLADGAAPADGGADTTYLQLVMERVWQEERVNHSSVLRLSTLEHLGGVDEVVETHLNKALSELPADQQETAARSLKFLVTSTGTKVAWTEEDLARLAELPSHELEPVVRGLVRLKILRPLATLGHRESPRYEIFHDALARPILAWSGTYAERQAAAKVDKARAEKEQAEWAAADARRRETRERKRKRLALSGLACVVVALIAIAITFAIVAINDANQRRGVAESIQAAERAADLGKLPTFGPALSGLASLEAEDRLAPTFEARRGILSLLQTNPAIPRIAIGHARDVVSVAFGGDGRFLVSGSADATIRLWDLNGHQIGSPLLSPNDSAVNGVAVAPSGIVASANDDETFEVWNMSDPRRPRWLAAMDAASDDVLPSGGASTGIGGVGGPGEDETAVAFSPDGRTLATADAARIRLWDMTRPASPRLLGSVKSGKWIGTIAFRPRDGRVLLTAGDGGVQRWRVPGFGRSRPIAWIKTPARAAAWAPDGSFAYGVGGSDPRVVVIRPTGRTLELRTTDTVESVAFTDNGSTVVSGGDDMNVTTWDVRSGRPFGPLRMEGRIVNTVAVSPDGRTTAAGGDSGVLKIWSSGRAHPLALTIGSIAAQDVPDDLPSIFDLAVGPNGEVASAAGPAGVFVWRVDPPANAGRVPRPLTRIPAPSDGDADSVAFHGNTLAASFGPHVELWDTGGSCATMPQTPCRMWRSPWTPDDINSLALSRSGRLLAAGSDDGQIHIWDLSNPGAVKRRWTYREPEPIEVVAFSPSAAVLAVGGADGTLRLWDVHKPDHPVSLTPKPVIGQELKPVTALAFAPDGKLLASGGEDQQIALWDTSDLRAGIKSEHRQTFAQTNTILSLAFSPDAKVLAAGDGDGRTCLYDMRSLRSLGSSQCLSGDYSFDPDYAGIEAVRFAQGGRSLLTAGDGNPLVKWNSLLWSQSDDSSTVRALRADVCQITAGDLTPVQWNYVFARTRIANLRPRTCARVSA